MRFKPINYSFKFIKDSLIYLAANVTNAAIPFLLLPFLTTHLSPYDYGLLTMFQVLSIGITPFIGVNFESTVSRYFFDYDRAQLTNLISNGIIATFLSAIIIALIFFLFSQSISELSMFPKSWLWSVVLFSFFQKVIEVPLALWRVQHRPFSYAVLRVLRTTFDIGLSVLLILVWDLGWEGRIEGQLIAVFCFGLFAIFYLFKLTGKLRYKKDEMKVIIQYGLPLVPHELGAFVITFSDRLFITNMVGLDATGIYSVGYQIGMIIGLLQNSFNQAWVPWFFSKLSGGRYNDKLQIVKITYLYNLTMLGLVLLLWALQPLLFYFLDEKYREASQFVLWISIGFAFNGMYKMVVNYLFYQKKTIIIGTLTIFAAVLNIGLNYLFIRHFGAIGAAYATAIALFIQYVVAWVICIKVYPMPWLLRKNI